MSEQSETRSAATFVTHWQPHEDWAETVEDGMELVLAGQSPEEVATGWRELAMMLGDGGAAELCLLVCLYGRSLEHVAPGQSSFDGHIDICLMSLGLALPRDGGDIYAIRDLGEPDEFTRDEAGLETWLKHQLEPFDGNLQKAAEFSLRLAAIKTGLLVGPEEYSVEQVLNAELWRPGDDAG